MKQYQIIRTLILSATLLLQWRTMHAQIFEQKKESEQEQTENLTFPPTNDDPINTPIDGGLGLLLAVEIGYGLKKVNDQRKAK